jgi:hypothetical protein
MPRRLEHRRGTRASSALGAARSPLIATRGTVADAVWLLRHAGLSTRSATPRRYGRVPSRSHLYSPANSHRDREKVSDVVPPLEGPTLPISPPLPIRGPPSSAWGTRVAPPGRLAECRSSRGVSSVVVAVDGDGATHDLLGGRSARKPPRGRRDRARCWMSPSSSAGSRGSGGPAVLTRSG